MMTPNILFRSRCIIPEGAKKKAMHGRTRARIPLALFNFHDTYSYLNNSVYHEMPRAKRVYRQTARAAAAEELRQRVATAFYKLLLSRWVDEITLDDVAASAGTTRQTVIRLFGSKEGLLEAMAAIVEAQAEPRLLLPHNASIRGALRALITHYEVVGDLVLRLLAQEERHPALRPILERGRREHRVWVAKWFGGALKGVERERQVTRLVVATDVYAWKLLRRDFGNTEKEVTVLMAGLLEQITGEKTR